MTDRPSHAHLQFESRPAGAPLFTDVVSTQEDLFHCIVLRKRSETILKVSPYITEAGDAILTVFLRTADHVIDA